MDRCDPDLAGPGGPWLRPGPGPSPERLRARSAWWAAREARLPARLRALLEPGDPLAPPPRALPPGVHAELERWLPWSLLRREGAAALGAWFGASGAGQGIEPVGDAWREARSWLDARRRLRVARALAGPAALCAALGELEFAWRLCCESHAPARHGAALGRHAERLRALAARATGHAHEGTPAGARLRAWDAGCATGEGTWELAAALLEAGAARVEVLGSDLDPLVVAMAERRARPHDPAAAAALREWLAERPLLGDPHRCAVRFVAHDLRAGPAAAGLDLVTCHGLLGEGVRGPAALRAALGALAGALRPGGLLSLGDTFRADRARAARELAAHVAPELGLAPLEDGVWARRAATT